MKSLQKVGAWGGFILALGLIIVVVGFMVVGPGMGVGPGDFTNPAKFLPAASTLRLFFGFMVLVGIGTGLVALGLSERLESRSPALVRVARAAGLGGAVLFLADGMFAFATLGALADLYSKSPAAVTSGVLALGSSVDTGLVTAGVFSAGWFILLSSWAARKGALSTPLSYFGLLVGIILILGFTGEVVLNASAVVTLIWGIWTGIELLRGPAAAAA